MGKQRVGGSGWEGIHRREIKYCENVIASFDLESYWPFPRGTM